MSSPTHSPASAPASPSSLNEELRKEIARSQQIVLSINRTLERRQTDDALGFREAFEASSAGIAYDPTTIDPIRAAMLYPPLGAVPDTRTRRQTRRRTKVVPASTNAPPLPQDDDLATASSSSSSSSSLNGMDMETSNANMNRLLFSILDNQPQQSPLPPQESSPKRCRADLFHSEYGTSRLIQQLSKAPHKRSRLSKVAVTIKERMRIFLMGSGDIDSPEVYPLEPCLFFCGPAVLDKQRRCSWLCHGFLGCDLYPMLKLLRAVCALPIHQRNGAYVDRYQVQMLDIKKYAGEEWAPTFYKGSNGIVCQNLVDTHGREVHQQIACSIVDVDESRVASRAKFTEAVCSDIETHHSGPGPAELLELRFGGQSGESISSTVEAMDRPVNYVFHRVGVKPKTWSMQNRLATKRVVPATSTRPPRSRILRTLAKPRHIAVRRVATYTPPKTKCEPRAPPRSAALPRVRFGPFSDPTTPGPTGGDASPPGNVAAPPTPQKKRRGSFYHSEEGSVMRLINIPQFGSNTHINRQTCKFNTILHSVRRLAVNTDCPLLTVFIRDGKLYIFHHGDLTGLLNLLTVGFCSFLEDTGSIPRESLGEMPRVTHERKPCSFYGPPVRSTCTYYFSTPHFLNRGRVHRTSAKEPIAPWPPRKYQPNTESECDTFYDREPPPIELCGPRLLRPQPIAVPSEELETYPHAHRPLMSVAAAGNSSSMMISDPYLDNLLC